MKNIKIAIIHYWWLSNRGGESVVTTLIDMYPNADLFLHVGDEMLIRKTISSKFTGNIYYSFISKMPFARKIYKLYLPLMPFALENLNLSSYDLILSSESGPSKGVLTRPDSLHICYCHTPMRYIWDLYNEYTMNSSFIIKCLYPIIAHWLRIWDRISSDRVDFFISNSNFISKRINKYYRRSSETIYPPVFVDRFKFDYLKDDYYIAVGQLVRYKRFDITIETFNRMSNKKLLVIGEGPCLTDLKRNSRSNIIFLGRVGDEEMAIYLGKAKALIFPGLEDFGIVPVEAMAAGTPVIAFNQGGATETVINNKTGILFDHQTVESLTDAIVRFEESSSILDAKDLHEYSEKFNNKNFKNNIEIFILDKLRKKFDTYEA